jgi:hypothetical protein
MTHHLIVWRRGSSVVSQENSALEDPGMVIESALRRVEQKRRECAGREPDKFEVLDATGALIGTYPICNGIR